MNLSKIRYILYPLLFLWIREWFTVLEKIYDIHMIEKLMTLVRYFDNTNYRGKVSTLLPSSLSVPINGFRFTHHSPLHLVKLRSWRRNGTRICRIPLFPASGGRTCFLHWQSPKVRSSFRHGTFKIENRGVFKIQRNSWSPWNTK